MAIRLVTYNIYMGACYQRGGDRLDRVCELVASLSPDVLALQECFGAHFVPGENGRSVAQDRLEEATGLKASIFTAPSGVQLYLMVRPEWAVTRQNSEHMVKSHGIGLADVAISGNEPFTIGTVHLYPWDEKERLQQLQWLSGVERRRMILLGDFNGLAMDPYPPATVAALPDQYRDGAGCRTDMARFLTSAGMVDAAFVAGGDRGPTYPTASLPDPDGCPDIRIDLVMLSRDLEGAVRSCRAVRTEAAENASDHRPVVAEVELV